MKRTLLLVLILGLVVLIPSAIAQEGDTRQLNVRITVEPDEIPQGRMGMVRVLPLGDVEIESIEATFLGKIFDLYPSLDGDWVGFLGVDMSAARGEQPLDVYITVEDDPQPYRERLNVPVVWGAFTYQDIVLPNNLIPLLDRDVNQAELNELVRVNDRITGERFFNFFNSPIEPPVIISEFGGIRDYNNGALTGQRHTGIDFRANTGAEVAVAADGRVIFSQRLPIHGNHIIVDHGWGILTGYSHLSERLVVPGQLVRQGEIIGLVGATGRVQGPHLHFEVVVNGYWVDPAQFLDLELPPSIPDELRQ